MVVCGMFGRMVDCVGLVIVRWFDVGSSCFRGGFDVVW